MPAGAGRLLDVTVSHDVLRADLIFTAKCFHQPFGRPELSGCGTVLFEVADQHNSDATLVVIRNSGMSAVKLLFPAEGRLNRAVLHTVAVADDEVISDTEPRVSCTVFAATM